MKTKHIVHTLTVLIVIGTVAFFVAPVDAQTAQTTEDAWGTWIDEQTDTVLKSAEEMDDTRRAEMRASIRAKFAALAAELKNEIVSPPQTQDYAILQTVKELRNTYDDGYNRKHEDTTVRVSYRVGDTEIFAYDEKVPLAEVDAKYPRDTWLRMLLEKGITIKTADAYWEYLFLRDTLAQLEKQPQVWTSGHFGIPPTEDWETYKTDYIERELGQIQTRLEKKKQPRILYADDKTLKTYRNLIEEHGGLEDVLRVLPRSIPKGIDLSEGFKYVVVPQTVKALRDAYDEKYNEKYAITSGSVSYKREGTTVFKYEIPLLMSEVDKKYPREKWLQMLLDKGITIDNFEEYWAYLSKRDELVALENNPKVWSSGLFGISPTDDWETYKAAYLKQMFEKFHRSSKDKMYFGKADLEDIFKSTTDVDAALKLVLEELEELERSKRSLRDR